MLHEVLYQCSIILNHFEGLKLTLTSLKTSYLEQLNIKIFALLPTSFPCFKIDRLIKRIGIIFELVLPVLRKIYITVVHSLWH